MARVLVADKTDGGVLKDILAARYDVTSVKAMDFTAEALRSQDFDLIAVDVQFDDSRMFDLLHLVKSIPRSAQTPVICFRSENTKVSKIFQDSMSFSTRALGAWMLVDIHELAENAEAKEGVLRIVERCLAGERRKAALSAREQLHEQRQEIHNLRVKIHASEWSAESEEQLQALRDKLTALLVDLCNLQMNTLSEQELVDDSRQHKDLVADGVTMTEDKATRSERKQALSEISHAVEEFNAAEAEEKNKRKAPKGLGH